jgi:hypothetical protein
MRPTANYIWMNHKGNEAILKELKQNRFCLKYQHIIIQQTGFNMSRECKEIWHTSELLNITNCLAQGTGKTFEEITEQMKSEQANK